MEAIGLADRWAFRLCRPRRRLLGHVRVAAGRAVRRLRRAAEHRRRDRAARGVTSPRPLRVYVETDPVVAELKVATGDAGMHEVLSRHHVLATYGENYGAPDCGVPLNGRPYVFTRQPVDLELWPMAYAPDAPLLHDDRQLPPGGHRHRVAGLAVQLDQAPRMGAVHRPPAADRAGVRAGADALRGRGPRADARDTAGS